eukprot:356430-Chlamydomonas_euryale.AAC.2
MTQPCATCLDVLLCHLQRLSHEDVLYGQVVLDHVLKQLLNVFLARGALRTQPRGAVCVDRFHTWLAADSHTPVQLGRRPCGWAGWPTGVWLHWSVAVTAAGQTPVATVADWAAPTAPRSDAWLTRRSVLAPGACRDQATPPPARRVAHAGADPPG